MVDSSFQIKLGRIITPDGHQKFIRLARHVSWGAGKFGKSQRRRAIATKRLTSLHFQRRVIVKFHLVKMDAQGKARQAQHLDYISRDSGAKDHEEGRLFGGQDEDIDATDFQDRSEKDPHQFRIIVSPEDSKQLGDLEAFTRDLMTQMESDMGTRLDWVAASHFDTATPHVHIVLRGVRGDGRKLIIPRRYIAYGLREQAERLVTLELGPMHVREVGVKLARQVTQDRLTSLDRGLLKAAHPDTHIVDVGRSPSGGEAWTRRLDIARLQTLSRMGLAQKQSPAKWKLSADLETTLRRLGERGDILKAYHKVIRSEDLKRSDFRDIIYDLEAPHTETLIGRVVKTGIRDDVNDKAYLVVDTLSGRSLYVPMGGADNLAGIEAGHIVEFSAAKIDVKPSDKTIDKIARAHHGLYSAASHLETDKQARPQFVEAHIRRLEAMRRAKIVTRNKDGSWHIPPDYLDRVYSYESRKLTNKPVQLRTLSKMKLRTLAKTMGVTWLDQKLMAGTMESAADKTDHGFSAEVKEAVKQRRQYLAAQKILKSTKDKITKMHLSELERRDLSDAGQALASGIGKPYAPAPATGKVAGRLIDSADRPSGRYAVIERAKDFTLVPWRKSLEKRRGMEISGTTLRGQINWQLKRQRGLNIE